MRIFSPRNWRAHPFYWLQVWTPKVSRFAQAVLPDPKPTQGSRGVVPHRVPDLLGIQSPQAWAEQEHGGGMQPAPARVRGSTRSQATEQSSWKLWGSGYSTGQESTSQFLVPAASPTLRSTSCQKEIQLDITSLPVPSSPTAPLPRHTGHRSLTAFHRGIWGPSCKAGYNSCFKPESIRYLSQE